MTRLEFLLRMEQVDKEPTIKCLPLIIDNVNLHSAFQMRKVIRPRCVCVCMSRI
ncbi:Uncharacterized protein APZ42_024433 [Daphnia magna]|uniref:Uncharacterized protein n=1 Tax=Daphnia magna TaxID=35525 RepID=A0A164U1K5_9CRUS|nr:Uncharacterized protein APZ42_024433 [Daphnia magna]